MRHQSLRVQKIPAEIQAFFFVFSPLRPFTPFHKTCQHQLRGMPACDGSKAKTTKLTACGQRSLALLRDAAVVLLLRGAALGPQPSPGEGAAPGAHGPC